MRVMFPDLVILKAWSVLLSGEDLAVKNCSICWGALRKMNCKKPRRSNWVELRTAEGKLACRYDPGRQLIEFVHRQQRTLFDLMEIGEEKLANEDTVCYTEEGK